MASLEGRSCHERWYRGAAVNYLETSQMRILLVEDFKPYRALAKSILRTNPNLDLICEAEDGVAAVDQAQQLKPDVILMDIGLPNLNGMAAARRIRDLVPFSKIVFLTQETDIEVAREAFSLGAWGYVVKNRAATDLLPALASIMQGKRFISRGLSDDGFASPTVPQAAD